MSSVTIKQISDVESNKLTEKFENNYILNNIIWYNTKEPTILERQTSLLNKVNNTKNNMNNISIDDLNKYLNDVKKDEIL
jgi:hypothetical protein